ncbi:MAG: hypothetical protein JNK49_06740, partial [Planctomycetes bacterium]|nr:hypothetical protein [Planctomycetota bacterium]
MTNSTPGRAAAAALRSPSDPPPGLRGLGMAEASARLRQFGGNRLVPVARLAWLRRLIKLVADPMALMLAAAALLYCLLGDWGDGLV